jgi:hypothetical protein
MNTYDLGPAIFAAGARPRIAGRIRKPVRHPGITEAVIGLIGVACLWAARQVLTVWRDAQRVDSGIAMLIVGFAMGIGWGIQLYEVWTRAVGR